MLFLFSFFNRVLLANLIFLNFNTNNCPGPFLTRLLLWKLTHLFLLFQVSWTFACISLAQRQQSPYYRNDVLGWPSQTRLFAFMASSSMPAPCLLLHDVAMLQSPRYSLHGIVLCSFVIETLRHRTPGHKCFFHFHTSECKHEVPWCGFRSPSKPMLRHECVPNSHISECLKCAPNTLPDPCYLKSDYSLTRSFSSTNIASNVPLLWPYVHCSVIVRFLP